MAAAQMLSISSSSLQIHSQQSKSYSHLLSTLCSPLRSKGLLLKSANSTLFLTTTTFNLRKPQYVSLRPRRGYQPVFMSLPTEYPERTNADNIPKWSPRAIKSFSMAEVEHRRMKYPKVGTECLLMGILQEGTSAAAKFLRANGVNLFSVRDEVIKLMGKSDVRYGPPARVLTLTEPAQKALDWAVDEKIKSGENGEVTTTDMLLGIWAQKGSSGQLVLAALGFDDKKFEELKSINEVNGFSNQRSYRPAIST